MMKMNMVEGILREEMENRTEMGSLIAKSEFKEYTMRVERVMTLRWRTTKRDDRHKTRLREKKARVW